MQVKRSKTFKALANKDVKNLKDLRKPLKKCKLEEPFAPRLKVVFYPLSAVVKHGVSENRVKMGSFKQKSCFLNKKNVL